MVVPTLVSFLIFLSITTKSAVAVGLPDDARFDAFTSILRGLADVFAISADDNSSPGFEAAPWYPTPYGGWTSDWADSYAKAVNLVANMTLAEKTNITTGSGYFMGPCVGNTGSAQRVGFPRLCLQDGPLGIRATQNNTAFPAGITTGATWNKDLMYLRGAAIGQEFRGKGINVHLGPSVGPLGRKPRGGRNWEGFGSDPVLQAVAAAQTIKGVQDQGVIATIKHWIANEQEMYRMYNPFQAGYSSNVDDRTMHELYMWPFAEAVRAGVGAAMAAYNAVNGSASCQNSYIINNLLKDELGFQGFIMSDWLAQISGVASALAGLDMTMPGDPTIPLFGDAWWAFHLSEAVLNGSMPVDRLNDMATRVVAAWYQMGQDRNYPRPNFSSWTQDRSGPLYPGALISPSGVVNEYVNVQDDHAAVARTVATEAITMLKNDNDILPLSNTTPLRIFGSAAAKNPDGINACADKGCNKGTLGMGWGSGTANYPYLDDPISAIKARTSTVTFYNTDNFPSSTVSGTWDVAVVFITADSGENYITVEGNPGDRTSAGLNAWHNGDKLVRDAAARYSTIVVIVQTVGPILMESWIDLPSVKAVLFQHLPGQESGESLTSVLFGEESPSGHLPYSIVRKEDDLPESTDLVGFELGQPQDTFSEGLYIDYRWLNKHDISPRYSFGHGLSYTTFELSNATITQGMPLTEEPPARPLRSASPVANLPTTIPPAAEVYYPPGFNRVWRYIYSYLDRNAADNAAAIGKAGTANYPYPDGYSTVQKQGVAAGGAPGGNSALWDVVYAISVTVTNTGARPGKSVIQAYVQYPDEAETGYDAPIIQLRDFAKTRTLEMGESEVVELSLTRKDVSVWDVTRQNWIVPAPKGEYRVWIGESSGGLGLACSSTGLSCEGALESPVVK